MIDNPDDVRQGMEVERDGEFFTVLNVGPDFQCKAPSDANWHHAVGYVSLSAGDNVLRVRTLNDFCQKYTIAEEEEQK